MEAIAPLIKVFPVSASSEAFIAVLLGIGFGLALEGGGLGNAKVLAGQWFGYNFAVFRVMFTAIVVAMLGIFGLHYFGVLNFELVYINPTYFWPQLVGGLVFGFGFAYGQHCPGTAVVGASTGNWDALSWLVGFLGGIIAFAFVQPYITGFYESGAWGRYLLNEALHIPMGAVVVVVVVTALGGFALTNFLDKKLGNKPATAPVFSRGEMVFGGSLAVAAVVVLAGAMRGEPHYELKASVNLAASQRVLPGELADWIVSGRRDFALIDMRSAEAYGKDHIRGAVNCGSCHASKAEGRMTESFVDLSKKLVIYSEGDSDSIQLPKILTKNQQLYRLAGGYEGWKSQVLAPVSFDTVADEGALEDAKKRDAVRAFMAGERATAPVEVKVPVKPIKRSGAHATAAAEGC
jgi:rhodanese-related sulfurtransferase